MPNKGASWRSEQLTFIAKKLHDRNSSKEYFNLINASKVELQEVEVNSFNNEVVKNKKRNIDLLIYEFEREKIKT